MKVVAVYNMKGGVGKTTTAVNLSYLAAANGHRVLVWDLDPQGAASFAFRVRPRVDDFGKKSLTTAETLSNAIKETDFANLHLLPADFAYRKFDRLLDEVGKPKRVMRTLLETVGQDYDVVFLDCPAGFSLLTEAILAAAHAVLVPTVPTVLSLRTLVRLIKWANRAELTARLGVFFSMVDRRKTLHRQACEWSREYPDVFFDGLIPYASVVEQMSVRRLPLAAFAPRDGATAAFGQIWAECESRLLQTADAVEPDDRWEVRRRAVETLMSRIESPELLETVPERAPLAPVIDLVDRQWTRANRGPDGAATGESHLIHRFDTADRDLQKRGHALELHERKGQWLLVLAPTAGALGPRRIQAQIDRSWAFDILSGMMSPLTALEQRLGQSGPEILETVCAIVGARTVQRVDSRLADSIATEPSPASIRQAV